MTKPLLPDLGNSGQRGERSARAPPMPDTRPGEISSPRERGVGHADTGVPQVSRVPRERCHALVHPGLARSAEEEHWGIKGKHRAGISSTLGHWPLPFAFPARAWSPIAQYLAFSSASTARRSMVLKRVFMARAEGRYRSFLH